MVIVHFNRKVREIGLSRTAGVLSLERDNQHATHLIPLGVVRVVAERTWIIWMQKEELLHRR